MGCCRTVSVLVGFNGLYGVLCRVLIRFYTDFLRFRALGL